MDWHPQKYNSSPNKKNIDLQSGERVKCDKGSVHKCVNLVVVQQENVQRIESLESEALDSRQ